MSDSHNLEKIDLIVPTIGKLFFERKSELQFCNPHLMPLKSLTLEKVERMQKEAHQQLHDHREKTIIQNQRNQYL